MRTTEPSKPPSLLKWIGIPVLMSVIFMSILYLAMENEPDYMPAQQKKAQGIDLHAKHANASTATTITSTDEHTQHSTQEHVDAVANAQTAPNSEETPSPEAINSVMVSPETVDPKTVSSENSHHGH